MSEPSGTGFAIREAMGVVSQEGQLVGRVSWQGDAAGFRMMSTAAGCAFETIIPLDWVAEAGDYVFLARSEAFVAANARRIPKANAALGRAA